MMKRGSYAVGVAVLAGLLACGGAENGDDANNDSAGGGQIAQPGPGGGGGGAEQASGGSVGAPTGGPCSKVLQGSKGSIPVCCAPAGTDKDMVNQVVTLLNQHRASQGKTALKVDPKLEESIQGHVRHMVERNFFSHTAPEPAVARFDERARLCGTTAGGENIAAGQRTPEAVMTTWKNSSGHNANMLGNYTRVGIGFYQGRWGQMFGR